MSCASCQLMSPIRWPSPLQAHQVLLIEKEAEGFGFKYVLNLLKLFKRTLIKKEAEGFGFKYDTELAIPGQTTTGKESSNPFMAGSLLKTIHFCDSLQSDEDSFELIELMILCTNFLTMGRIDDADAEVTFIDETSNDARNKNNKSSNSKRLGSTDVLSWLLVKGKRDAITVDTNSIALFRQAIGSSPSRNDGTASPESS
ncbi:hypothetical protein Tco_0215323 [Tanacetum coccineum]